MPLSRGELGCSANTMSPGPRPISIPSGILIHPAVWPQQTWAENSGGCAPFSFFGQRGSWLPIKQNVARVEAYLRAKFHLDPSNRLATIHQRCRETDRQTDRQQSRSTGRTVLQTVAQKRFTYAIRPLSVLCCLSCLSV